MTSLKDKVGVSRRHSTGNVKIDARNIFPHPKKARNSEEITEGGM